MISPISFQEPGSTIKNPIQVPATKNISEQPLRPERKNGKEFERVDERLDQNNQVDKSELSEKTDKLNQVMDLFNYSIRFTLDEESKRMIVKVVNSETDEVIRQIPPKEMLQLMNHIDQVVGVILDEKV